MYFIQKNKILQRRLLPLLWMLYLKTDTSIIKQMSNFLAQEGMMMLVYKTETEPFIFDNCFSPSSPLNSFPALMEISLEHYSKNMIPCVSNPYLSSTHVNI